MQKYTSSLAALTAMGAGERVAIRFREIEDHRIIIWSLWVMDDGATYVVIKPWQIPAAAWPTLSALKNRAMRWHGAANRGDGQSLRVRVRNGDQFVILDRQDAPFPRIDIALAVAEC